MQPLRHSLPLASGSESDERPQVVELQEQAAQLPPTITSDVRSTPSANLLQAGLPCMSSLRVVKASAPPFASEVQAGLTRELLVSRLAPSSMLLGRLVICISSYRGLLCLLTLGDSSQDTVLCREIICSGIHVAHANSEATT